MSSKLRKGSRSERLLNFILASPMDVDLPHKDFFEAAFGQEYHAYTPRKAQQLLGPVLSRLKKRLRQKGIEVAAGRQIKRTYVIKHIA